MPIFLVNILIGLALNVAASLLGSIFAKPQPKLAATASGIRATETTGGDTPLSFILGTYGTAGHREYSGTWGSAGGTPNAYYTLIRSVSDLPVRGLAGLFIDGERVTIGATHSDKGYPITEYRRGSKDHLWIEFFDGTQTVADTFMVSKFGTDPDRPWTSDMIGRGIAYARLTALFDREIFNSLPDPFFEVDGIALEDPRTGTVNHNPIVQIHQILSGITYGGEWVWGLQGLPATRLPAGVWPAQMDKCDVPVALAAGGTEPRFRAGTEISVDQQPIEVIAELLESCNGRIAEIGGIYKVLVAEPGDAVIAFTDGDFSISEGQSFDPFPGLESTYNAINATYPEPDEKWAMKDAPALREAALVTADDDRLLPADVSFPMVPYGTQAQRLMKALLLEDRRFRSHTGTLPPEWWEYEVLDTATWTSARNGYDAKVFLITTMDDLPNGNQFVGFKEQDPADYGWDEETDEQSYEVTPIVVTRPTPQLMTGWTAIPATMVDPYGNGWLPTIEVGFDSGLVDVRAVRVQVREGWDDKRLIFDGSVDYDPAVLTPSVIINASFLPNRGYEGRGLYVPFSGRITRWSNQDIDGTDGAWLGVTTPNVSALPPGSVTTTDLNQLLKDAIDFVVGTGQGSARSLEERILDELDRIAGGVTENTMASDRDRKAISSKVGDVEAAVVQESITRASADVALSQFVLEVAAQAASGLAEGLFTVRAEAAPSGVLVRLAMLARVTTLTDYVDTGILIDLVSDGGGGFASRILLKADSIYFTDGDVATIPMVFEGGVLKLNVANIGTVKAGRLQNNANTSYFDLNTGAFRISA